MDVLKPDNDFREKPAEKCTKLECDEGLAPNQRSFARDNGNAFRKTLEETKGFVIVVIDASYSGGVRGGKEDFKEDAKKAVLLASGENELMWFHPGAFSSLKSGSSERLDRPG